MRRWLRKRLPTAHEVVYEYRDWFVISYSPNERGYEGVLAIRASANGVRLYFNHGKQLSDPAELLQGSCNQTRSINLEGASTLARPEVAGLIDEAIARNRVPFARAGRGSVVIRSTSAKQRSASPRGSSGRPQESPKSSKSRQETGQQGLYYSLKTGAQASPVTRPVGPVNPARAPSRVRSPEAMIAGMNEPAGKSA
jgi:hypothetical protein